MERSAKLLYLIVIGSFLTTHLLHEAALRDWYPSALLTETLFPTLHRLENQLTDLKFRMRRNHPPVHTKVAIVDIDGPSLAQFGRWPWNRNLMAALLDHVFQAGAKAVALDIFFSEKQEVVPESLQDKIAENGLSEILTEFNYDQLLASVIHKYKDRIVLGWGTENFCRPALSYPAQCPPHVLQSGNDPSKAFQQMKIPISSTSPTLRREQSPLLSTLSLLSNIPLLESAAEHAGFVNASRDADGVIRRAPLVMMVDGNPYPSLPLELARVVMNETLEVEWDSRFRITDLRFKKQNRSIPISPIGMYGINFRGEAGTIPSVSALDLLSPKVRSLASDPLEKIKDAAVFIGVSAIGVGDIIATPLEHVSPGVEVQATIFDNLIAGDGLQNPSYSALVIALLLSVGAFLFISVIRKMEARPIFIVSLSTFLFLTWFDSQFLFGRNIQWNASFLAAEYAVLLVLVLGAQYLREEQNRKYLKDAFSKYVSPAVVDSIVKDRNKLSLGGRKETLSILFTDIRGFTTISEAMDPKVLGEFIIEYNSLLTDLIFESGGTLDKYIGDAIMAFWGAPLSQPDHAERACQAAIKMAQTLAEKAGYFESKYGVNPVTGFGINSGSVTVGNMGSNRSFGYTVIGDQVNLASRIEGVTKLFGVNVLTTENTLNSILPLGRGLPAHRILGSVKVKGKTKSVEVSELLLPNFPKNCLTLFEAARKSYLNQNFSSALDQFEQVSKQVKAIANVPDGPSQAYIKFCNEYLKTPPTKDWDGSFSPDK